MACGYGRAKVRTFIADGAPWLWKLAKKRFTQAIPTLDFFHVCQHVCECSNTFFAKGSDAAVQGSWRVRGLLREGLRAEASGEVRPGFSRGVRKTRPRQNGCSWIPEQQPLKDGLPAVRGNGPADR